MSELTVILGAVERGEPQAAEQLLSLVYAELRRLAGHKMAQEKPGQTLSATGLVHEAYLRLFGGPLNDDRQPRRWDNRGHFFSAAAEAMRRILIENARRKKRLKHGGGRRQVVLRDEDLAIYDSPEALLALDEALEKLAARRFGCRTIGEASRVYRLVDRPGGRRARLLARNRLSALELCAGLAALRIGRHERSCGDLKNRPDFVRQTAADVA